MALADQRAASSALAAVQQPAEQAMPRLFAGGTRVEPMTSSLPWNHREPLCGPPFPQLRPTVDAKVIGSPSAKLCAHFRSRCS
jgi:hypothetical protein